jgi:hypothetical protein
MAMQGGGEEEETCFVVLFETGQYFFCGPSIETKHVYLNRLMMAVKDMTQSTRLVTYGLL